LNRSGSGRKIVSNLDRQWSNAKMLDNGMVEYTNIPITNNSRDEYGKFVKGNKINYGRIPSVTQREKQSMAMSGRPLSNEHKSKSEGQKTHSKSISKK
jgi:hypothetical protein